MAQKNIPEGFTVAYVEGKWYPLEAERYYSGQHPDGSLSIYPLHDEGCSTQREAIQHCQVIAETRALGEQSRLEHVAQKSDVYPERCAFYEAIIEEITGRRAIITRGWCEVRVFVSTSYCAFCNAITPCVSATAMRIEDALEEAAQQVYASRCVCERVQEVRLQQVIRR